jgi:nucleoporin NUP82
MNTDDDWTSILTDHPIFSLPKCLSGPIASAGASLELSSNTLPDFLDVDPSKDGPTPSGRRQVMVLKDADLVLAVGKEIRVAPLGDSRRSTTKSYKVGLPLLKFRG